MTQVDNTKTENNVTITQLSQVIDQFRQNIDNLVLEQAEQSNRIQIKTPFETVLKNKAIFESLKRKGLDIMKCFSSDFKGPIDNFLFDDISQDDRDAIDYIMLAVGEYYAILALENFEENKVLAEIPEQAKTDTFKDAFRSHGMLIFHELLIAA